MGDLTGLIFLSWVISAAVCAKIAQTKNLDALMWGLVGFFVGPFALPFVALAGQRGDSDAIGSKVSLDKKQCYACAELVRRQANVCRYCGAEFDEKETAMLTEEAEEVRAERENGASISSSNAAFVGRLLGYSFLAIVGLTLLLAFFIWLVT